MKLYVIDYRASGDEVAIVSVKGFNSPNDVPEQGADVARLVAQGAGDLRSLGEPVLAALWAFKAKKDEGMPEDAVQGIWDKLNPPPKKKLTKQGVDGTGTSSDAPASPTGGKKMASKKKVATKKKPATRKKSDGPRGEKMKKLADKLASASGCTRKWVADNLGWKTISFQQIAKALGRKLTQDKEKGKPTIYFAKA